MALYAIGDTHLSLSVEKPMDVFGGAWVGYVDKLVEGFQGIKEEDTVVLCGDLSWGMGLEEAKEDFAFLNALPGGRKLILKGNHDYWGNTANKMNKFFRENDFDSLEILHNNCFYYGDTALCGTRGWFYEETGDQKVFLRELGRLETSLKAAGESEKLCFLHYPPLYQGYTCPEIMALLERYGVKACYYGHLHGGSHRLAVEGARNGVDYRLVAADFVGFKPLKIMD